MLTDSIIKEISHCFCGDTTDTYNYKSGPELVRFFNEHFEYKDKYPSWGSNESFPSRWQYVYNKIVNFINNNTINIFFSKILSIEYIMLDLKITKVQATEKYESIINHFNTILEPSKFEVVKVGSKHEIVEINSNLTLIGEGGFARVYINNKTHLVEKHLKEDYYNNKGIKSRFKREFDITKKLNEELVFGIINVCTFNERNYFYTMELAEQTLEEFLSNDCNFENKINIINQIMYIMSKVHERNIIHRDISHNNIFIKNGKVIIADFGLGKDLNIFHSHMTLHTNAFGQLKYCAPEQFMNLKDSEQRADVFSLGMLINYILRGETSDYEHFLKSIVEKATSSDVSQRYNSAIEMKSDIESMIDHQKKILDMEEYSELINNGEYDEKIAMYINSLSSKELYNLVLNCSVFESIFEFMNINDKRVDFIISKIEEEFNEFKNNWKSRNIEHLNKITNFLVKVILSSYTFTFKERVCYVLYDIAVGFNRFYTQDKVKKLIDGSIEPFLEEILKGER